MMSGGGDVGGFLSLDFLVDTEIPHEMRFAFSFLLHNLSQAELRVEKVIVPNKTPASNSIEKKSLSSGVGDRM